MARSRAGRCCAARLRVTSPACSSTFRCFDTAWRLIENGSASSFTVASPRARRASIARRVGSANAANVRLSWSVGIGLPLVTERGDAGTDIARVDQLEVRPGVRAEQALALAEHHRVDEQPVSVDEV